MTNRGSFVKGIITGAAVGMTLSMVVHPMDSRDRKRLQKGASRFFTTVGGVIDNVMDVL